MVDPRKEASNVERPQESEADVEGEPERRQAREADEGSVEHAW